MCYDIAGGIKRARKELNMTQAELAKKLGISKESLSRYEKGKSIPGMDIIIKLADYTNHTTDEILRLRRYDVKSLNNAVIIFEKEFMQNIQKGNKITGLPKKVITERVS